jgi:hypothetical protein
MEVAMWSREVITFFIVLFGGGALFYALGVAAVPVDTSAASSTLPLSLPLLCIGSGVVGILSGCLMYQVESFKTSVMHIISVPLFFVLGRDSLQPVLTFGCVTACYALLYLVAFLLYDKTVPPAGEEDDAPEVL